MDHGGSRRQKVPAKPLNGTRHTDGDKVPATSRIASTPLEWDTNPWTALPDQGSGWDNPYHSESYDSQANDKIALWLRGIEAAEKGERLPTMEEFLEERERAQQAWHESAGDGWGDVDPGWHIPENGWTRDQPTLPTAQAQQSKR
ncbi:hypothetical protein PUNSTDRAFT_123788 [Punctularia strigosozonata HHB-11173 SS5]|uniref:uncharacterized protein n=1 Tax=Punctularia strigosozonata (strain HHB-11173) TaxID=741275 RepID=UPI0004417FC4|nr:uncharacterized protein PUNSTDRAFT_123788 [Punctularia strigosozonata HHB-11173 SS5]EIN14082.1 hypothetical protein PUNSTDRAFT_123788 [Punctularia strigosozonata HHB-11173 SS5]